MKKLKKNSFPFLFKIMNREIPDVASTMSMKEINQSLKDYLNPKNDNIGEESDAKNAIGLRQ